MTADAFTTTELLFPPQSPGREDPVARRSPPPIAILGVAFDNVTLTEAVKRVEEMIASRRPHYIVTANVDFLVQARRDAELRRIFLDAHLVLCDGTPLVWASRLLGNPLPERVAGADLVPELIRRSATKGHRLFFLGASEDANAQAVANMRAQFPGVNVVGRYSPPFRALSESEREEMAERIREAQPDILFVAFGCPKAEKWIAANYRALGVPVVIGVGATIDFLAGRIKRAPLWMQRGGVEWIYRLCQEPRRLFKRYVTDLWHFSRAMLWQCWELKWRWRSRTLPVRSLTVIAGPNWRRVEAARRLNAISVRRDRRFWTQLSHDGRHCLLDMTNVETIDSTGVAMLLRLQRKIRSAGRHLVLLSPPAHVRRALRLMRLDGFFEVAEDAVEARRLTTASPSRQKPSEVAGFPNALALAATELPSAA